MAEEKLIRMATLEDAEAIFRIYAEYIKNTTVTFEIEVLTLTAFRERMAKIMAQFPWLVCEIDGEIAGYAYASKHGERAAYRWSADLSVYISKKFHRRGIATAFYKALAEILRTQGYFTVYAGVSTPNPKSEAFHTALGFRNLGEFRNVGYKLGQWLGVTWYELSLAAYVPEPEEPVGINVLSAKGNCKDVLERMEKYIR